MNDGGEAKRGVFRYRIIDYVLRRLLRALPVSQWSEAVALRWGVKYKPTPAVVRLRSGVLIHVDPRDYLQLLIYYLGTFEPYCLQYLKTCTGKGATIVDVGANIGVYTLEGAVVVGATGRVISIEPAPVNAQALKKNVERNHMTNVAVIETAVGDTTGSATLSLRNGANLGMFTLAPTNSEKAYNVDIRRIDDLLAERGIGSVDFIKIDVEGSEYRALLGARKTLLKNYPPLLIELCEATLRDCQSSTDQVTKLLNDMGYLGWVIEYNAVRPIRGSASIPDECECLFVHRDSKSLMHRLKLPS